MSAVDPADLDLATLSALAGNAANHHLLEALHRRGHEEARVSHGYVFQHLIDGTPTVGELAAKLGVTQQAASKTAAELERMGYVERLSDAGDSRVRRIGLTPHGRDAIQAARQARLALEAEMEQAVGPEALRTARAVLATLLSHLGATESVASRGVRPTT
jgi:DNA-binding MarR family transcriptional regulator